MTSRRIKAQKRKSSSGSPPPGGPEFLVVGKLHRPHGVSGEMRMSVWTDFPERIVPGARFYVGEQRLAVSVRSARWHGGQMLIAFEEYSDREQVGVFRNQLLYVRSADLPPLAEGKIYLHQMLGLQVFTEEGEALGVIEGFLETGANDVLVLRTPEGKELLLPDIELVVKQIDLQAGAVYVHLLPGLRPD
ncbi:MAG: 16S rRNA processing protein RimM [Anaerolineae bacterium]|nr:MAG: 16S rRNA processing protein RimM [Anaerolineae bacterium]